MFKWRRYKALNIKLCVTFNKYEDGFHPCGGMDAPTEQIKKRNPDRFL